MSSKPQTSFHVRFTVPAVGEQIVTTPDHTDGGIVLVGASTNMPGWLDLAVVLVVDLEGLGLANPGASVTNSVTSIVSAYREIVAQVLDRHETQLVWIQIDSMGNVDQFYPDGAGSLCNTVTWGALPGSGAIRARSMAAFLQAYPIVASRLLARIEAMTGCDLQAMAHTPGALQGRRSIPSPQTMIPGVAE